MTNEFPYRPNVAILLYNHTTHLLWIGERHNEPGHWQFPQGGVDAGSSLEENVLRELSEELGAAGRCFGEPQKLRATHRYDFSEPRAYGSETFRGQDQTFWVVAFLGKDSAFDLLAHEPEFQAWRWVTPDEVRRLAPARRMVGYEPALREFESLFPASKRREP